jgi:hypothetical protein
MSDVRSYRAVGYGALVLLFLLPALAAMGYAQQSSRSAAIVLTATVAQSMTMTVWPTAATANHPLLATGLPADPGAKLPVTVTANWVLGPGNISVAVLSSGNPLLGDDAISRVPVALLSPLFPLLPTPADSVPAENFLSTAKMPTPASQLELRIDTSELRLPAGSEDGVLTIRAQAF